MEGEGGYTMPETVEDQKRLDDELIPNPGDKRFVLQKGKITHNDGSVADADLWFERKRNENGGIDVVCHAPAIGMKGNIKQLGG